MSEQIDQVVGSLKAISEELADMALAALKSAHAAGSTKRPDSEKNLTQARRAVEKAVGILSRVDSDD
jgi:hypothetical protein